MAVIARVRGATPYAKRAGHDGRLWSRTVYSSHSPMPIGLRAAQIGDFDFCARLYFSAMEENIRKLELDAVAHREGLRQRWVAAEVQIITFDAADIGWMQSFARDDALFLAQIFVDAAFQRRGIGSKILHRLIDSAGRVGQPVTLGVVKATPARRLYERLGFRVTHQDDRKFYMRREPDAATL